MVIVFLMLLLSRLSEELQTRASQTYSCGPDHLRTPDLDPLLTPDLDLIST